MLWHQKVHRYDVKTYVINQNVHHKIKSDISSKNTFMHTLLAKLGRVVLMRMRLSWKKNQKTLSVTSQNNHRKHIHIIMRFGWLKISDIENFSPCICGNITLFMEMCKDPNLHDIEVWIANSSFIITSFDIN